VIYFLFIIGLVVGSFTNVVIDRLPSGKFFNKSRSYCESCKKTLKWYDLFPLFSFIFLFGKCRYCKEKIPSRLPFVEFISGLGYSIIFVLTSPENLAVLPFYLALYSALVAIFFIDTNHQIIPDVLLMFMFVVALIAHIVLGSNLIEYILTGLLSGLLFLLLFLGTKGRGMGFGDVKFAVVIGFILGFPTAIFAFYAAFVFGAIISVFLIFMYKMKFRGTKIAFGPFMILGLLFAVLFSEKIVAAWF